MFSGIFGFGDWNAVIQGLPYQSAWGLGMTFGGALLYVLVVRMLAITIKPFVPDASMYNIVGRVPYYAAGAFSCIAGLFDGHVSIDTTNVHAEADLETKALMLAACGSFTAGNAPTRRWRHDRSLMEFLRSL